MFSNKIAHYRHQKLRPRSLLLVFSLALNLGMLNVVSLPGAQAAVDKNDPIYVYCKSYLENKAPRALEACDEKSASDKYAHKDEFINIFHARNVATYHCDNPNDEDCIVKVATKYIRAAANPVPSSPAAFVAALNAKLDEVNGSPNVPKEQDPSDPESHCRNDGCDFIEKYVNPGVNLLSLVFGLVIIISIIMGGIQYSASQGDPQKVTRAKQRITNTIIALVAYFFLYAFLQFLIPGGIFKDT